MCILSPIVFFLFSSYYYCFCVLCIVFVWCVWRSILHGKCVEVRDQVCESVISSYLSVNSRDHLKLSGLCGMKESDWNVVVSGHEGKPLKGIWICRAWLISFSVQWSGCIVAGPEANDLILDYYSGPSEQLFLAQPHPMLELTSCDNR